MIDDTGACAFELSLNGSFTRIARLRSTAFASLD
jgi:hypothetical protein